MRNSTLLGVAGILGAALLGKHYYDHHVIKVGDLVSVFVSSGPVTFEIPMEVLAIRGDTLDVVWRPRDTDHIVLPQGIQPPASVPKNWVRGILAPAGTWKK